MRLDRNSFDSVFAIALCCIALALVFLGLALVAYRNPPPPDCHPRVEYGGRGFVVVSEGRAVKERRFGR